MRTIVRYIRDFSIVVAGIAVTLYVNDKVTYKGEKKDLKRYLNAVKIELEANIRTLDNAIDDLQPAIRYSEYLKTNHRDSLNRDTISNYEEICFRLEMYGLKTNAFEMFKTSGVMRLVDDKDLLLTMWSVYSGYSNLSELMDWNYKTKWEDIKKDISHIDLGGDNELKDSPAPLYNYHYTNTPKMMSENYKAARKITEEMVIRLENEL